jgi:hypothetical protein
MSTERYAVKLANGKYLGHGHVCVKSIADAFKYNMTKHAYGDALRYDGAKVLRLKPSKRAEELARLRAEVDELRERCRVYQGDTMDAEIKLDAMAKERDELLARAETACREAGEACNLMKAAIRERDALAAQLARAQEGE